MSKIKLVFLCSILGFLFTIIIYAKDFDSRIFRYIFISIFYCCLYIFGSVKFKGNRTFLFCATIATPILIDASVLITYPAIVPLRFPFASLFPLIGAITGALFMEKRRLEGYGFVFLALFFFIFSHNKIIPSISYRILNRDSPKIDNSFLEERFYTITGDGIKLSDTLSVKCTILECYFVGCLPCEQKVPIFRKIKNNFNDSSLSILMICDGRYTKFDSFLRHSQKNKYQGFIFLYDQDSILYKRYQFKGYPVELLVNKQQIVATKLGYDDSFSELYYEKQIRLIKTILDENDD